MGAAGFAGRPDLPVFARCSNPWPRGAGWRRSRSPDWQTRVHTALGAEQAGHRTESTGRGERYTRWV